MDMFLICLGIIVLGASSTKAQTCFSETILKPQITDTDRGVIYSSNVSDTVTNVTWSVTSSGTGIDNSVLESYFNFNISDGMFWMYTTESFDSFSENAYSDESSTNVQFELYFNCDSTVVMVFLLIQDGLSYAPTFSQPEYEFIVPMPITKYSDFTLNSGENVIVNEINFSNKNMTFSIEPDHFDVSSTKISNKSFKASFQAKDLLQFTENQTYTLTATNTAGNKSSVQLTIIINSEDGLDTPLFNQPYYLYEFSDNTLISKSDSIKVTSGKSNNCTYKLNGDYAGSFQIGYNNETSTFELSLSTSNTLSELSGQLFLSLLYTTDATTTTAIIVDMIDLIPSFSQDYYKGVYDASTKEISWTNEVLVYPSDVEVKLDDDVSALFTFDDDNTIKPTDALSDTDFDDNNNIIFSLTAVSSTKNETKATVLISLKSEQVSNVFQFDHLLYNAKYEVTSDSATVTLDADSKIGFKNLEDFTGLVITVDSDFNKYFDVILSNDGEWIINVTNKLTNTILLSNTELIISLTANKTLDGSTAEAVLVVSLPDLPSIQFEKAYYKGTYKQSDDEDTVVLDEKIAIKGVDELDDLSVLVDGYESYLKVTCTADGSSCLINVNAKLDNSTWKNNDYLILTIIGTGTKNTLPATSQTVLVLDLPSTNQVEIKFEKTYYLANYVVSNDDNNNDTVELVNDEQLIHFYNNEQVSVTFELDAFENNFELVCSNDTWLCSLVVLNNLDESILANSSQLGLTIIATASKQNITDHTVLILSLPVSQPASIEFEKAHYSAEYIRNTESDSVTLSEGDIVLKNSENFSIQFSLESYNEVFSLIHIKDTTSCILSINQNLNDSVFTAHSQLILTVTATASETNSTSHTVLIINLPTTNGSEITFKQSHYSGQYVWNSESDSVELLDGPITLQNPNGLTVQFKFDDYNGAFALECVNNFTSCSITVDNKLDTSVLTTNTQLILTITATALDGAITDHTVLVLDLPDIKIVFEQVYYSARYVLDSSGESHVTIQSDLISLKNEHNLNVTFNFDGYDDIFNLSCQNGTTLCGITVLSSLSSLILTTEAQLIITINAVALEGNLTSKTALILDLPGNPHYLSFGKTYYTGAYKPESLKLDEILTLSSPDYENITFTFETFKDSFEVDALTDVGTYSVKVNEPLNETVLSTYAEIIVDLTVENINTGDTASTALSLKLPLYLNDVFESDHYEFEYLKSSTDSTSPGLQILGETIKIKSPEYTNLVVLGYEEYLSGSCDSETLSCALDLQKELNETTLSSTEVLVTLVASTLDNFSTGKSVLLLSLPPKNSTFAFTKSFFRANYSIQSSGTEPGSLTLLDNISLEGAYTTGVEIIVEDYSDYIRFTLSSSEWTAEVVKNLEANILSESRQLITSLIANSPDGTSSAKATLVIQLPDESTIYFSKSLYYGNYDISNQDPQVILADDSRIEISDMQNTQISLDSMSEYFEVVLNGTTWVVDTRKALNSTFLSQYSELNLEMSIDKAGVSYGKAVLIIRLPSLQFSNEFYEATYAVDNDGNANFTTEQIKIDNIDSNYVDVTLTDWTNYFSVSLVDGNYILEVKQKLTPNITQNYGTLVANLVARRILDDQILATSTLIISLANVNSTDTPSFAQFTFYGQYKNSDSPTVSLDQPIKLAYDNQAVLSSVSIDSSSGEFGSNFELQTEDYNNYTVKVLDPLSQETIENISNIVLTLIATSTQSVSSYATLVIELPKAVRNSSVQVENQEILFTGTYENGILASPTINLKFADSTENEDVTVTITNDLGIDDDYFHYSYVNHALTIEMDSLPDDLLTNLTVIPLKLAITDRSTQDTVHAVLNVNIGNDTGSDASSADNSHQRALTGLIVAVSILAALLALLLLAGFAYWFFKLRKSGDVDEEATPATTTTTFTKKEGKKPFGSFSNGQLRRPTGLAVGIPSPILEDSTDELDDETPAESPELDRKVAFNDNVEQIDTINDEDDGNDSLQSVADRRPTKFVFSNPVGNGILNLPDDRRESSDYHLQEIPEERRRSIGLDEPEGKKAVAFDDNVERMHIDTVEPTEEEEESDEDSDEDTDRPQKYRVEAEMQVTDHEKLSSL